MQSFYNFGILYDWFSRGAIHRVYWMVLLVMFIVEVSLAPQVNGGLVEWINQGLAAIGECANAFYQPEPSVEFYSHESTSAKTF